MEEGRKIKDMLYEQVARIGKVLSSPKRLELIELLCQGEKTVETLANEASISIKLTSAHLRELRTASLVETERDGKHIRYRLASKAVADLWVHVHALAEEREPDDREEEQERRPEGDQLLRMDHALVDVRRARRREGRRDR